MGLFSGRAAFPGIAYAPARGLYQQRFEFGQLFGRHYTERGLKPGRLLIRISSAGVCASDREFFYRTQIADTKLIHGLPLGHEMSGVVEEAGEGLDLDFWLGSHVAVESHCPRYFDDWDRMPWYAPEVLRGGFSLIGHNAMGGDAVSGGWTAFSVIPHRNAFKLTSNVLRATGGFPCLLEPSGNAVYLVLTLLERIKTLGLSPEEARVAVFGLGQQGTMMMHLAESMGISHIAGIDVQKERTANAAEVVNGPCLSAGPDAGTGLSYRLETCLGGKADFVIDACGALSNLSLAISILRQNGELFFFGLKDSGSTVPGTGLTLHDFVFNQERRKLDFAGCRVMAQGVIGRSLESWRVLLQLLDSEPDGALSHLIRSRTAFMGSMDRFETELLPQYREGMAPAGKVVMRAFRGF